jgi:hypothetical protein
MTFEDLKGIKAKCTPYIFDRYAKDVVGVGVSEKVSKGKGLGNLALTIYVKKKKSKWTMRMSRRIDKDAVLLEELPSNLYLDIKEIGEINALEFGDRVRPVETGISEGHYAITAGTGSVLVTKGDTKFRLSNNHVYANQNNAFPGDAIHQPGPYDYGGAADRVGVLEDFVELKFTGANYVDAAIRTLDEAEHSRVFTLNASPVGMKEAELDSQVVKVGRTTEFTSGRITDLDMTVQVGYGNNRTVLFEDQILVSSNSPFSQGGDSGSAVFEVIDGRLRWVGLLFAGDETGKTTICNHASKVAELLGVTLFIDPEPGDPVEPPPDDGNGGGGGPLPPGCGDIPGWPPGAKKG